MSKLFEATVVSAKMQKTIVARVDRTLRHPRYGKVLKKHKTYKVHCEDTSVKPGDFILIQETKPISKDKHFLFVKKIKSGTTSVVETLKDEQVKVEKLKKETKAEVVKAEAVEAEVEVKPEPKKKTVKKVATKKKA